MVNDDDRDANSNFDLFRNKRVMYPTIAGLLLVVGILLYPLFF
ncbi:hypothetical protein [Flaviflexus equikiangi]|nr:hypothetical protein [Flaviflexus equikiangi]